MTQTQPQPKITTSKATAAVARAAAQHDARQAKQRVAPAFVHMSDAVRAFCDREGFSPAQFDFVVIAGRLFATSRDLYHGDYSDGGATAARANQRTIDKRLRQRGSGLVQVDWYQFRHEAADEIQLYTTRDDAYNGITGQAHGNVCISPVGMGRHCAYYLACDSRATIGIMEELASDAEPLDSSDYEECEREEKDEAWSGWIARDYASALDKLHGTDFAGTLDGTTQLRDEFYIAANDKDGLRQDGNSWWIDVDDVARETSQTAILALARARCAADAASDPASIARVLMFEYGKAILANGITPDETRDLCDRCGIVQTVSDDDERAVIAAIEKDNA